MAWVIQVRSMELPPMEPTYTFDRGVEDAKKEIAKGQFRIIKYGLTAGSSPSPEFEAFKKKYSLTVSDRYRLFGYERIPGICGRF